MIKHLNSLTVMVIITAYNPIMKKKYTREDYVRIHDLVYKYKDGDKDAGEELINSFSRFIGKYISLLHFGNIDLNHGSTRRFIKLFVADPAKRNAITPKEHNANAVLIADATVRYLVMRFSRISIEDIRNELICALLLMAKKYKDTKPSFQSHVEKNFHFYAYRSFEKLTSDPCCYTIKNKVSRFCVSSIIDIETDYIEDEVDTRVIRDMETLEDQIAIQQILEQKSPIKVEDIEDISIFEDTFINSSWADGITCSQVFKNLSIFERKILMMWHMEKKTDSQIAEHFGVCRGTINSKRAKAKEKLEDEFKRLNLSIK